MHVVWVLRGPLNWHTLSFRRQGHLRLTVPAGGSAQLEGRTHGSAISLLHEAEASHIGVQRG